MRLRTSGLVSLASFGLASLLVACQGNLGSGSGLSIPAAPQYNAPGGPGGPGAASQTRERTLDGAAYLTSTMTDIPLPSVDGYGVTIALGTPTPEPSPAASAASTASARPAGTKHRTKTRALASPGSASSTAAATEPSPFSPPPSSTAPLPSSSPSAAPSPSAPTSAAASPGNHSARPSSAPAHLKTVTKTVVFPERVPTAPTPMPTGDVQTFLARPAILRGYIRPAEPISIYGLGAVRFTIPKIEQTAGRGFTIALFAEGKRHREALVAFDPTPTRTNDTVASRLTSSLSLKKGVGYDFILYGDELAPSANSVPAGYPAPGNNPFLTPYPGAPGTSSAPGVGIGNAPHGTVPSPFASQTPTP